MYEIRKTHLEKEMFYSKEISSFYRLWVESIRDDIIFSDESSSRPVDWKIVTSSSTDWNLFDAHILEDLTQ